LRNHPSVADLYVHPAMGDSGLSLGAAQLLSSSLQIAPATVETALLGNFYTLDFIRSYLTLNSIPFKSSDDLALDLAQYIASGKIVGLFRGRMEWGPRALGSRSILASPLNASINTSINERLNRSDFMPFAPMVLDEDMPNVFTDYMLGDSTRQYMTSTYSVNPDIAAGIPAVVHCDMTARPQAITQDCTLIYPLLKNLKRITGFGICINTSFNFHEEPIVESPKDALRALKYNAIDVLVLEDLLVFPH